MLVAVVLGLSNMSPPTPATMPTIPAAAIALLHFNALLLETGLLAILSSGNSIHYQEIFALLPGIHIMKGENGHDNVGRFTFAISIRHQYLRRESAIAVFS